MPSKLLVTGAYRSGTTLLEKLLHSHPSASVASQPFPVFYFHVMAAFHAARGLTRRYPLGHLFLETGYTERDLATFLDDHVLDDVALDRVFADLAAYREGLWTPEILGARDQIHPGRFLDVYDELLAAAVAPFAPHGVRVVGSKETFLEELAPYLLARGVRVIVIVRDPRDLVASLELNVRDNATGAHRPVLFSVRVWRKSVATILTLDGHPGFRWLRYEDLVTAPDAVLAELATFLQIAPYPPHALAGELRDQRGAPWGGNSSFRELRGVSTSSVGGHRAVLPPAVRAFVEALAAPELRALGYPIGDGFSREAITAYRDPFPAIHAAFPADYSSTPARVAAELDRHAKLADADDLSDHEARRWFLSPAAYRRLRRATP